MIDQLLDLTRARVGGGIPVERRQTNLGELCRKAVEELEQAYPTWKIEREVAGDQNGLWDPDRLLQIISNLVEMPDSTDPKTAPILVRLDGKGRRSSVLSSHDGIASARARP